MKLRVSSFLISGLIFLVGCATSPIPVKDVGPAIMQVFVEPTVSAGASITVRPGDLIAEMDVVSAGVAVVSEDYKVDISGPAYFQFRGGELLYRARVHSDGEIYCSTRNVYRAAIGTAIGRVCTGDRDKDGFFDTFYVLRYPVVVLSDKTPFLSAEATRLDDPSITAAVPYTKSSSAGDYTVRLGYRLVRIKDEREYRKIEVQRVQKLENGRWVPYGSGSNIAFHADNFGNYLSKNLLFVVIAPEAAEQDAETVTFSVIEVAEGGPQDFYYSLTR